MNIKPVKTENDYQAALSRLNVIFDAEPGTSEGDELEVLGILINNYEKENDPIEFPDPIEAIKFRMEQMNYNHTDLSEIIGSSFIYSTSEILNRNKKLTLEMIRRLHKALNIPTEVLIQPY